MGQSSETLVATGPRRRGLPVRIAVALILATVATVAQGKEIDGILRAFVQEQRQLGAEGNGYGTAIDIRWDRDVSALFSYLVSVRYLADREQPLFFIDPIETTTNQVEPRIQLDWSTDRFDVSIGQRWLRNRTRIEGQAAATREETNGFAHFRTRFDELPNFLVEADRRDTTTTGSADRLATRALGQISYGRAGWNVSAGYRHTVDETEGFLERTVNENLYAASVNKSLNDGRVNVFANWALNDLDGSDRLDRETLVPIPRMLRGGLSALDDTPTDGPLGPDPALVDGDRSTPGAANIGGGLAGGATGWNLGAELALVEFVDVVDVWISPAIDAVHAARYRFAIYHSVDNLVWTRLPGVADLAYDPFDGRFRLTFAETTARYIKVVNETVDDALGAVFVTEIELFGRELRRGTTRTRTRTENASAVLSWSPVAKLNTTASGSYSRIRSDFGSDESESRDTTANVAVNVQPVRVFLTTASVLSSRRRRTGVDDETDRTYSISLTGLPVRDLDLTAVGSIREQSRGPLETSSNLVLLRAASLLHTGLSLAIDYEVADEENPDRAPQDRETWRIHLDTRPREEIEFNTSLLSERVEVPSLPVDERRRDNIQWRNRLTLRPSSVLSAVFEATWFDLPDRDGWSRIVQLDWLPFAGGSVQLSFDYREDVPLSGQERVVRSIGLRWNLNRKMFLDFDGTRRNQEAGGTRIGDTTVTAFFQARF